MSARRRRLAIIGGGSSGLITLKNALDRLKDWDVVCFEKSDRIIGCWGSPYPGFVSTSTKYTTQFACFPEFAADVVLDAGRSRSEFFREGEYGRYLERFAEQFSLRSHIVLQRQVESLTKASAGGWELQVKRNGDGKTEVATKHFDCVVLCTGLAAEPKDIAAKVPRLSAAELNDSAGLNHIHDKRIVVVGGGESAVDYANRLARTELRNEVFLSLYSGVRVSPRYHPIRGVPSDFLRNRLMLSIHPDLRNWIGQRFVVARILYQEMFECFFPKRGPQAATGSDERNEIQGKQPGENLAEENLAGENLAGQRSKEWAHRLTKAAKDDLFNMFHNKSDDFLLAVGAGRIKIVGPAVDDDFAVMSEFDGAGTIDVAPDLIVPAVGYRPQLDQLSAGLVKLSDFFLGCVHTQFDDLFLVGFARPIIGNIPTISELQAQFVTGLISGEFERDPKFEQFHRKDMEARRRRYQKLNVDAVYPVEMFPYCDRLADLMKTRPTLWKLGSIAQWIRMQIAPASTLHYQYKNSKTRRVYQAAPIYMPTLLILLLLMLKPCSWFYTACCAIIGLASARRKQN
jgi:dimethylaniline monooxygenase (N-oxide forming)